MSQVQRCGKGDSLVWLNSSVRTKSRDRRKWEAEKKHLPNMVGYPPRLWRFGVKSGGRIGYSGVMPSLKPSIYEHAKDVGRLSRRPQCNDFHVGQVKVLSDATPYLRYECHIYSCGFVCQDALLCLYSFFPCKILDRLGSDLPWLPKTQPLIRTTRSTLTMLIMSMNLFPTTRRSH